MSSPSPGPLPPYLTLRDRLTLTWLATPVISLVFIIIKLVLSSADIQSSVVDLKADVLASCQAAEKAATVAASLPRYMAEGTNKSIVDAVNGTMAGAKDVLILSIQALEAIVDFMVNTYQSTYLCFLELVVRAGLALLIGAVSEITSFLNTTLSGIVNDIKGDISAAQSAVNSVIGAIDSGLDTVFGSSAPQIPQISIPHLSELSNITIPTDFENSLISLNDSLPTLSQLKSMLTQFIDTPFQDLISDINSTFNGLKFDDSLLSIPPENQITFCNSTSLDNVIDELGSILAKVPLIAIGVSLLALLLVIAANCTWQWYRWRHSVRRLEKIRVRWATEASIDGLSSNPLENDASVRGFMGEIEQSMILNWLELAFLKRVFPTPAARNSFRWFVAYVTYPPAIACLLIGLGGILSAELQLALITVVTADSRGTVDGAVDDLTQAIADSINGAVSDASAGYVSAANAQIATFQASIDDGVLGWVNTTTTSLNTTIVQFYADVTNAVNSVFGNTILASPINEFVKCILGNKVTDIEEALTFIHNNVQITLPTINPDLLTLSNQSMTEISTSIASAAVGTGSTSTSSTTAGVNGTTSESLADKLIGKYTDALHQEEKLFAIFIVLWVIVLLTAVGTLVWAHWGKDAMFRWKQRRWERRKAGRFGPGAGSAEAEKEKEAMRTANEDNLFVIDPASLASRPPPPTPPPRPIPSPALPPFPPPRASRDTPPRREPTPELPPYASPAAPGRSVPRRLTPVDPFTTPFDDAPADGRYPSRAVYYRGT